MSLFYLSIISFNLGYIAYAIIYNKSLFIRINENVILLYNEITKINETLFLEHKILFQGLFDIQNNLIILVKLNLDAALQAFEGHLNLYLELCNALMLLEISCFIIFIYSLVLLYLILKKYNIK